MFENNSKSLSLTAKISFGLVLFGRKTNDWKRFIAFTFAKYPLVTERAIKLTFIDYSSILKPTRDGTCELNIRKTGMC